jgi:hypothetical protein
MEETPEFEEETNLDESSDFFEGPQRSQTMPNIATSLYIDVPSTVFESENGQSPKSPKSPKSSKIENDENGKKETKKLYQKKSDTLKSTVNAWSKSAS